MKAADARKLLGVERNATSQAIKKAFRHLAMLWHPDRNPAPEAHEMFARLSAACDLLLEPFLKEEEKQNSQADMCGPDRNQDIEVSLEQLCQGGKLDVSLDSAAPCTECDGAGFVEHNHSQLCPHCQGSGRVRNDQKKLERCADCAGRGFTRRTRCTQCGGSGRQIARRTLAVTLPPGMLPGDELRLAGEGYAPASGKGRNGDLRLRIQCHPEPPFSLDRSHIVLDYPVSAFILLGGGSVDVPTPLGTHPLKIAAGSAIGREQSVSGAGIPARGKRAAGNLRVRFIPLLPATSPPSLLKLYRAIQSEIDDKGLALQEPGTDAH